MPAKRCPDCRGSGYRIIADKGEACGRCEGVGHITRTMDVPPATREVLAVRSGGMCEVCHVQPATDVHHRQFRSRSGDHNIENLLHVCGPGNVFGCHGDAHGWKPLEGTTISRYERRPIAEITFVDKRGTRWKLHTDGTKSTVDQPEYAGDGWRKP